MKADKVRLGVCREIILLLMKNLFLQELPSCNKEAVFLISVATVSFRGDILTMAKEAFVYIRKSS